MHNLVCRLCLQVTAEDQWALSDICDVFNKIHTCLNLEIITSTTLPNKLCQQCVNKIEQINDFYVSVKSNQQTLLQHVQNGSITDYYVSITNESFIKKENNLKTINIDKNNEIKKVNDNIDHIHKVLNTNIGIENKDIEIHNDLIKDEVNLHESYSSDDENYITLALLKEEKATNKEKNSNNEILENAYKNVLDQYNCLTCDQVYETHSGLRNHYKAIHTTAISSSVETSFTEQILNGNITYRCDKCNKVYSKKNMKRHILYHSNERPYVCKLCARTYKTVSDIMRHGLRAHSGHKLHCSYKCGFNTAYTGALKEHEDRVHKNKYKYTCEECGKGFQVKTWYDQHQNLHTGLKPFVCDICGQAFHMDKYLKTHYSTMHPQSLEKKRHVCLHCDVKCDSVNSLAVHLQNEHGVSRSKSQCKKSCLCDYCGKVLNRPEQLQTHRRMHLGEKPYQCSICKKSFLRKFSARVHERTHFRSREHECEPCGTRYSQPSALYRHQRIHHGLPRKRA